MMRRALLLLCLAAVEAGLRLGKPSGAGALKMQTREEEKVTKAAAKAKRKAAMSKDPETAKRELRERLSGYNSGEKRAQKYMQIARKKKFGMSDEDFAKQQQTYGRVAMDEAQMEMRKRYKDQAEAKETQRIRDERGRLFRKATGRSAKATDSLDDAPVASVTAVVADGGVSAVKRSARLSPAAKKVLKGSALVAAAAALGKLVLVKLADRSSAPAPAAPKPDVAEPVEEAVAPAADDADAAPVPGMSAEAAARLAEAKVREELLGRIEGQYKLRGEPCPLSVGTQTVPELEATLAELRGGGAAGDE